MGARIFLAIFGLFSLPYGLYCFFRPGFLESFAGVAATSTTGTVELQAMYGGLQTAFGALALLGALQPAFTRGVLITTAFLCAGLGASRLLGGIGASEISSYTAQGVAFELGSASIATWLLRGLPQPVR